MEMKRIVSWVFGIWIAVASCVSLNANEPQHKKRVYVDVVGDLPHMGHIEFYKQAKAFGDYLIVGILSDEDVASYKRVPILNMTERASVVQALSIVDEVIVGVPLSASEEWLKEHQIDVVVHGDDADAKMLQEQYADAIRMGIFHTVPYTKGISTTEILRRIQERQNPKS